MTAWMAPPRVVRVGLAEEQHDGGRPRAVSRCFITRRLPGTYLTTVLSQVAGGAASNAGMPRQRSRAAPPAARRASMPGSLGSFGKPHSTMPEIFEMQQRRTVGRRDPGAACDIFL